MERKRLLIILATISVITLLAWPLIKNMRASNTGSDQTVTDVTLCDVDDRALCIVAFGTDNTNRMVINFQLPSADYPAFYVNGSNKGMDNVYQCEAAKAIPTSVYCTGIRTPLGEAIDIEVYSTEGNLLMAHGTAIVSAIMVLTTPIDLIPMPEGKMVTPTPTPLPSPTATLQIVPTPTVVFTPTPDVAYPSP